MTTAERTAVRSLVSHPSGWLPVVVACGNGAALAGVGVTWVGLAAAGAAPGRSEVARWTVGGPVSAIEGTVWFLFDAHPVRVRTGHGLSTTVFGHPMIQADASL